MKITLGEAVNYYNILAEVTNAKLKLPARLSLAINRNLFKLGKEVEIYEKERTALLTEAAEKDEDGKAMMADRVVGGKKQQEYIIQEEKKEKLFQDIRELLEMEIDAEMTMVEMDQIYRIDEDARFDPLTTGQINGMRFMIKE